MTPSSADITVRKLEKDAPASEIDAATEVMVSAFERDKWNTMLVAGHSKELFPGLFGCQIKAALIGGSVYVAQTTDGTIVGAAAWFGPDQEILGSEGQAEAGFNQFMQDLGSMEPDMPGWWMSSFLARVSKFSEEKLGPGYQKRGWQLQLIGVLPEYQRKGVGSSLIKFVEEIAWKELDQGARHMTCETETEEARKLYVRLGFIEKGKIIIEGHGGQVPMWNFLKEIGQQN